MKKSRVITSFLLILLLIGFVFGLWYQSDRVLSSSALYDSLVRKIQNITHGSLTFKNVRIEYFPQPCIIFEKSNLDIPQKSLRIQANSVRFDFKILPLFLGRAEPSAFYAQEGNVTFKIPKADFLDDVVLNDFSLEVGALGENIPVPFTFTSAVNGRLQTLSIKGNVILDSADEWDWSDLSGAMTAELKDFSLEPAAQAKPPASRNVMFRNGVISTIVEIRKKTNEEFLQWKATGDARGVAYDVLREKTWTAPPPLDARWSLQGEWNQETSEFRLNKGTVKLPFGDVDMNGTVKLRTGMFEGFRISGANMALEDLLKYCPKVVDALPTQMGFSGPGKWVFSIDGTAEQLTIHFDCDLSRAFLSYGQYFTKHKNIPLDLNFDFLIQKNTVASGDFALKFQDLSLKGTLKNLDLKTGLGQLNVITNKFKMDGWEQYVPVLSKFKLGGEAKLMANWKGDLKRLEKTEHIFNLSFDNASWLIPETGLGIQNATFSIDYSPLILEGRKILFNLGKSAFTMDLSVVGIAELPQATIKLFSEHLDPTDALESFEVFFPKKENEEFSIYTIAKSFSEWFLPKGTDVANFNMETRYDRGIWDFSTIKLSAYQGDFFAKGTLGLEDMKQPEYRFEFNGNKINLGSFDTRHSETKKIFEGTLNFNGNIYGEGWGVAAWEKTLNGQGEWTITKGKLFGIDFKEPLTTIDAFKKISSLTPDFRSFDKMNFRWKVADGKISTDNLLTVGKDFVLNGEGTLGLDGLANYRAEVFLSNSLARQVLPNLSAEIAQYSDSYLGPISTLLSGPLTNPDLKTDPAQVAEFVGKISRERTRDILRDLVLE